MKAIDRLEGECRQHSHHELTTRVLDVFRARDAYLATWLEDDRHD